MNLIRRSLTLASLVIAFGLNAAAAPGPKVEIKPTNAQPVSIESNKTRLNYYPVSAKDPLTVKVIGPGSLKIVSRIALSAKKKEAIYGLAIVRDGKERDLISKSTKRSKATLISSPKKQLGKPQVTTIKVPSGEHEYQVSLAADSKMDGYARFAFEPREAKAKAGKTDVKYIAVMPRKFPEEATILIKEDQFTCYRASAPKPVEVEVIGPATMKIVSRLEFDHTMRGDKPYRVQVSEGDKIIQTMPFTGRISGAATYVKSSDKVIGKGDSFLLNVPQGKHRYLVNTPDPGLSILLRFYLPQGDLGNELKPNGKDGSAATTEKTASKKG